MKRRLAISCGLVAAVLAGAAVWHQLDRTVFLQSLCKAGLPNFSRPDAISSTELGCTILSSKGRYRGVVTYGFETASFSSASFDPVADQEYPGDPRAWFTCIDCRVPDQSFKKCGSKWFSLNVAEVEAEGWVTVSAGGFGHLGGYPRALWSDRILRAVPADDAALAHAGLTSCVLENN